jgi:hypothetical protein
MSTSKNLGMIVGATLVVFILVFGSILMFGLLNTITDISPTFFNTIYFAFVLIVLGAAYMMNTDMLCTKLEHVLIISSLLIFSAALATFAGSVKNLYDVNQYISQSDDVAALQAQGQYYSNYAQSMIALEESIKSDNKVLAIEVAKLTEKINNKTPVVVETIVTLPPETIYVEDNTSVINDAAVYYDNYNEYEREDD